MVEAIHCEKVKNCAAALTLADLVQPSINGLQGRFANIPAHLTISSNDGMPIENPVHPRNTLNDLNGSEWLYYSRSVWVTSFPSRWGHELRREHGANKPPDLMRILIEMFTKPGETVLDPFAGVGGTLIGASIATIPRKAIGIEINPQWAEIYEQVIERIQEKEAKKVKKQEMIVGDALDVLNRIDEESIDFIATDPPYFLHLKITMSTGDYPNHSNRKTSYNMKSESEQDLANLPSPHEFFEKLRKIGAHCHRVLKNKHYMAMIIRDAYQNGEYIMTHAKVAEIMKSIGFRLKGDIIWTQTGVRLRPYGYPYAYVPNIIHQHILIFRKE